MSKYSRVSFQDLIPLWIPASLVLLKLVSMLFYVDDKFEYAAVTARVIVFSGFSFYAWAFIRRLRDGMSIRIVPIRSDKKMRKEGSQLIALIFVQYTVYWLFLYASITELDFILRLLTIVFAGALTYYVPYWLITRTG